MTELMGPNGHAIFGRVARIVEAARAQGERSVNTATFHAYRLISCEIVEVELEGRERAEYGEQVIRQLAARLTVRFGEQLEEARRLTFAEDSQ